MSELLRNSEFVWVAMAILIFLITFLFKYPYKKLTNKIKDEGKRKLANKAIVIFAFAISFALNFAYCHYFEMVFTIQDSLRNALSAIALHSALEIKSNGKVENVFNTVEGNQITDMAIEYVDKKSKTKTEKKEKEKEKKPETAIDEFWKSVNKK